MKQMALQKMALFESCLLGDDNLDVSDCFLQEEKYVLYCFSEQWRTKKKSILDFPGKTKCLISDKFLFSKIVQNYTDLLCFNDSSEKLSTFLDSQNIFPSKISSKCWIHLVKQNWHNLKKCNTDILSFFFLIS